MWIILKVALRINLIFYGYTFPRDFTQRFYKAFMYNIILCEKRSGNFFLRSVPRKSMGRFIMKYRNYISSNMSEFLHQESALWAWRNEFHTFLVFSESNSLNCNVMTNWLKNIYEIYFSFFLMQTSNNNSIFVIFCLAYMLLNMNKTIVLIWNVITNLNLHKILWLTYF